MKDREEKSALALSESVTKLQSQITETQSSVVQEVQSVAEEPAADESNSILASTLESATPGQPEENECDEQVSVSVLAIV